MFTHEPAVPPFFPGPRQRKCCRQSRNSSLQPLTGLTAAPYSVQAGRSRASWEPYCRRTSTIRRLSGDRALLVLPITAVHSTGWNTISQTNSCQYPGNEKRNELVVFQRKEFQVAPFRTSPLSFDMTVKSGTEPATKRTQARRYCIPMDSVPIRPVGTVAL